MTDAKANQHRHSNLTGMVSGAVFLRMPGPYIGDGDACCYMLLRKYWTSQPVGPHLASSAKQQDVQA